MMSISVKHIFLSLPITRGRINPRRNSYLGLASWVWKTGYVREKRLAELSWAESIDCIVRYNMRCKQLSPLTRYISLLWYYCQLLHNNTTVSGSGSHERSVDWMYWSIIDSDWIQVLHRQINSASVHWAGLIHSCIVSKRANYDEWYDAVVITMDDNDFCVWER